MFSSWSRECRTQAADKVRLDKAVARHHRMRRWRNRTIVAVVLGVVVLIVSQCQTGPGSGPGSGGASDPPRSRPAAASSALSSPLPEPLPLGAVLARIPVGALDTARGDQYRNNRTKLFGRAWIDVDHNGCATDDDIARRDLVDWTPAGRCAITGGELPVTYSGGTPGNPPDPLPNLPRAKQLDHVNALGHAYGSGAAGWSPDMRVAFANDPRNLIYTDRHGNESKGDSGPDEYLPPNPRAYCRYVDAFVRITEAYPLTLTPGELDALRPAVALCPTPSTVPAPIGGHP